MTINFEADDVKQLGLFPRAYTEKTACNLVKSPEDLRAPYIAAFNQGLTILERSYAPPLVEFSSELWAIDKDRANHMVFAKKSSRRSRQDADFLHLLARDAWAAYLEEDPNQIFQDWINALGKGNKGQTWAVQSEIFNLRAVGEEKPHFYVSKANRFSHMPSAYVITRVKRQTLALTCCELIGFCYRHDIRPFMREIDTFYQVRIDTLKREGLLYTPAEFKQHLARRGAF